MVLGIATSEPKSDASANFATPACELCITVKQYLANIFTCVDSLLCLLYSTNSHLFPVESLTALKFAALNCLFHLHPFFDTISP